MESEKYNEEPVCYCTQCLSLRIMYIPGIQQSDYCDTCGSTNVKEDNIDNWKAKYFVKYGKNFI